MMSDGDTGTVIKYLKVKGSSSVIKVGTKVKNLRLVDGIGAMNAGDRLILSARRFVR